VAKYQLTKRNESDDILYDVHTDNLHTLFDAAAQQEVALEFGHTVDAEPSHEGEQSLFEATGHPEDDPINKNDA
jgi:hypothetical protein